MDLTESIKSAENQFKQILEDFFISIFNETQLPSHGLGHHRRVWNTAKELTVTLGKRDLVNDQNLISSLIIASYLHDLGMALDNGPRHGRYSHDLCKRFLKENNLGEADFPGLLQAVREHDNKDYSSPDGFNLKTILSVSDDLDAFGHAGIYRYIEIYLLRGVPTVQMGSKIRENARKRYLHFEQLFKSEREILDKHRKRYEILDVFFTNHDRQVCTAAKDEVKVMNILADMIISKKDVNSVICLHKNSNDRFVNNFFTILEQELDTSVSSAFPC